MKDGKLAWLERHGRRGQGSLPFDILQRLTTLPHAVTPSVSAKAQIDLKTGDGTSVVIALMSAKIA